MKPCNHSYPFGEKGMAYEWSKPSFARTEITEPKAVKLVASLPMQNMHTENAPWRKILILNN